MENIGHHAFYFFMMIGNLLFIEFIGEILCLIILKPIKFLYHQT